MCMYMCHTLILSLSHTHQSLTHSLMHTFTQPPPTHTHTHTHTHTQIHMLREGWNILVSVKVYINNPILVINGKPAHKYNMCEPFGSCLFIYVQPKETHIH